MKAKKQQRLTTAGIAIQRLAFSLHSQLYTKGVKIYKLKQETISLICRLVGSFLLKYTCCNRPPSHHPKLIIASNRRLTCRHAPRQLATELLCLTFLLTFCLSCSLRRPKKSSSLRAHTRTHACTHARTHAPTHARAHTRTHARTRPRTHPRISA